MENGITILVENLGKKYRIGLQRERKDTFIAEIGSWLSSPVKNLRDLRGLTRIRENTGKDIIWALRDVSFDVKTGEVLGIIGRNGAGKSTLLKILSQITYPTTGRAIIDGRVSSLLEVGTGFHNELTGRENIYLNGTILGMSKREIDTKFDAIIDFSGVEKYIDTPIKRYSSGMKVRLAFSVAAHLHPEILLIDEVLAVGDFEFQNKCLGKMNEVAKSGRTVLFVSHNMSAIKSLCTQAILIQDGELIMKDDVENVVNRYTENMKSLYDTDLSKRIDRSGNGQLVFNEIQFTHKKGDYSSNHLISGKTAYIYIKLIKNIKGNLNNVNFILIIKDRNNVVLFTLNTRFKGKLFNITSETNNIVCEIPRLALGEGVFWLTIKNIIGGKTSKTGEVGDYMENAVQFNVIAGDYFNSGEDVKTQKGGYFLVDHKWAES